MLVITADNKHDINASYFVNPQEWFNETFLVILTNDKSLVVEGQESNIIDTIIDNSKFKDHLVCSDVERAGFQLEYHQQSVEYKAHHTFDDFMTEHGYARGGNRGLWYSCEDIIAIKPCIVFIEGIRFTKLDWNLK